MSAARETITWAEAQTLDAWIGNLTRHELRNELRYQAGLKVSRHVPVGFAELMDKSLEATARGVAYRSARSAGAIARWRRR